MDLDPDSFHSLAAENWKEKEEKGSVGFGDDQ
jgi:hypothetical protein